MDASETMYLRDVFGDPYVPVLVEEPPCGEDGYRTDWSFELRFTAAEPVNR